MQFEIILRDCLERRSMNHFQLTGVLSIGWRVIK